MGESTGDVGDVSPLAEETGGIIGLCTRAGSSIYSEKEAGGAATAIKLDRAASQLSSMDGIRVRTKLDILL
jgi:hypothetical protein